MNSLVSEINYEYDAFNRLSRRYPTGGSVTYWVYDEGINPVFEYDTSASPTMTHRYLWSDNVDELLADEQNPGWSSKNTLWALSDHLGSIRDIADTNETTGITSIANHRRYDATGKRISETNTSVDLVFGYTGKLLDETTGLQNNLNRWLDPATGRWISQDPIGFAAGDTNLYRYVGNSPTNATDPSGLVLIAIDGTGTKEWLTREKNPHKLPNGRWLSHVRNFIDDDEEEAIWDFGPSNGMTASDLPEIEEKIYQALANRWRNDASKNNEPIDIIGWSRGAYSAMRIAKRLKEEGLPLADGTIQKDIPVRFL